MIIVLTGYSGAGKTEICKIFKRNRRWKIFEIGKYYIDGVYPRHWEIYRAEAWIKFALAINKYDGDCIVEHCGIYPNRNILDLAFKDKEVYSVHLDCSEEDMIRRIKNKKWYKEALGIRKEKEIISTSKKLRKRCNKESKSRWVYDSSKLSPKEIYNKICKDLDIGRKKEDKYFFNIVEYGIMNPKFAGYRSGRIEVHKKGENYAIDEGNFLIPEKYIEQFRDMLDFTYTDTPLRIHLDMFKYPDEDKKYYANLK